MSVPQIWHNRHKFRIARTNQLVDCQCIQCITVAPQNLGVNNKVKPELCHQTEHITDIPIVHSGKCFIQ